MQSGQLRGIEPAFTTTMPAPDPFDLDLTAGYQTNYRGATGVEIYHDGLYARVLRRDARALVLTVQSAGGNGPPALQVGVSGTGVTPGDLEYATQAVSKLLGLNVDLHAFYALLAKDPILAGSVNSLYGLRPPRTESVYEALVMAVVGQQISGVIARRIQTAIITTYGTSVAMAGEETLYAFPTPRAILEAGTEGLRSMKLSGRKVEYIQEISMRTLDGTLDDVRLGQMENEEVVEELVKVRGIGRWTAEWMLLRALGRVDAFPVGDLAIKRVVSESYFGGAELDEKKIAAFAKKQWYPYRGLVTTYLFAHLRRRRAADAEAKRAVVDGLRGMERTPTARS